MWLKEHDLEPSSLLKGDLESSLSGWIDRSISAARVEALMNRGAALGLAFEKWQRVGLWFLTQSDPDYPVRLERRLGAASPAVLFGCGSKRLLNRGGIAVVGSRNAGESDLALSEKLGRDAAAQGYSIVSGGARGVDQRAMLGALESEGTAVGVLADSLLRSATSAKYRKWILAGDLVLVSPFNPEAGFNVGNAMFRNRYIYCLADAAVVVSSTFDKGGTWRGAIENLEAAWVPLWAKHDSLAKSGNPELVRKGARWLPDSLRALSTLLDGTRSSPAEKLMPDLPLLAHDDERPAARRPRLENSAPGTWPHPATTAQPQGAEGADAGMDFYAFFLTKMLDITATAPLKPDDIAAHLGLRKTQVNDWLKLGVCEGKIEKLTKPVRYRSIEHPLIPFR